MVLVTKDKDGIKNYIEVVQIMGGKNGIDVFGKSQEDVPFRQYISYNDGYKYIGVIIEGIYDTIYGEE